MPFLPKPTFSPNAALGFAISVEQWATVYRGTVQYILAQMEQWVRKGGGITQHARIRTTRTSAVTNHRHRLVGSVLGFCVIYHIALRSFVLYCSIWAKYTPRCHGIPSPIALLMNKTAETQCLIERKSLNG